MQVGTSILPRVNCDVAVMWRIPPPNSSSSYKVSAVFPLSEIGDIFICGNRPEYDVIENLIFYCLWCILHRCFIVVIF